MEWLAENWFFLLMMVLFISMHLFGHRHGGHGAHRPRPNDAGHGSHGGQQAPDER